MENTEEIFGTKFVNFFNGYNNLSQQITGFLYRYWIVFLRNLKNLNFSWAEWCVSYNNLGQHGSLLKSAFAEAFQVLKVVFTAIERNTNRFSFKTVVRSIEKIFNVVVFFVGYYFFLLPLKGIQIVSFFRVYL